MRLYELTKPLYYHASAEELEIGTMLVAKNINMTDSDIEEILERFRPKKRPARSTAVYMVQDRKDLSSLSINAEHFVYCVQPDHTVTRLDHGWVHSLYRLLALHDGRSWETTS